MPGTVVIHTAFPGDLVLLSPLLDRITMQWPDHPVYLVTTPVAAPLYENDTRLEQILIWNKRGGGRGMAGFLRLRRRLRQLRPQRVIVPHRYARSSLLALSLRTGEIYGFQDAPLSFLFRRRISRLDNEHETRRLVRLIQDDPPDSLLPRLQIPEPDVDLPQKFVVLAPGSVWPSKRWPYYSQLAQALLELDAKLELVIIGAQADAPDMEDHGRIRNLLGKTGMLQSAAIMQRALAVVCNDSLPLHLAQAAGVPTIGIFGSTHPRFGFGPQRDHDRVIQSDLDCRPCNLHGLKRCPLGGDGFPCLEAVTVTDVIREIQDVTGSRSAEQD